MSSDHLAKAHLSATSNRTSFHVNERVRSFVSTHTTSFSLHPSLNICSLTTSLVRAVGNMFLARTGKTIPLVFLNMTHRVHLSRAGAKLKKKSLTLPFLSAEQANNIRPQFDVRPRGLRMHSRGLHNGTPSSTSSKLKDLF